jgi:hypothetical protein
MRSWRRLLGGSIGLLGFIMFVLVTGVGPVSSAETKHANGTLTAVGCSAAAFRGNKLFGPAVLPREGIVGLELTGYGRFGKFSATTFLSKFRHQADSFMGAWRYPPADGFKKQPDGKPIIWVQTLKAGQYVDRYGNENGRYLSPAGLFYSARSLPPSSLGGFPTGKCDYHSYRVLHSFKVDAGPIAPWFAQPGGGLQYLIKPALIPGGAHQISVKWLVNHGYLGRAKVTVYVSALVKPHLTAAQVTPVTHLGSSAASLTLWLTVGFVLLGGVVAAFGRSLVEGGFRSRSGSTPGAGRVGRTSPDRTFMRSWLALALVGGLLIFAAVSFQLDDTALRSSLLGGVIASAGAATAFYFASKSSDQARQDILNASFPTVTTPNLIGKTRAEVNAILAGAPLYLDALPPTASDTWTGVSQDPQPNQQTTTGSRVHVTFAGNAPDLNNMTRTAAEAALSAVNLMLKATPQNAATSSTAQADQTPAADSPPPLNRTVTVSFQ